MSKQDRMAVQKVSNFCKHVGMTRSQRKFYMTMFNDYTQN